MNWSEMFFQDWTGIARTVVVGLLAYAALVAILRISGKRTLAKLNAFDLVVTVALGSTLASILLQESIALAEGITALVVLIAAQYAVTFTSVRWPAFAAAVRAEPTLLVNEGKFCTAAMRRARVTPDEALSAIRAQGGADLRDAETAVLESDGSITVRLRDRV